MQYSSDTLGIKAERLHFSYIHEFFHIHCSHLYRLNKQNMSLSKCLWSSVENVFGVNIKLAYVQITHSL